MKEDKLRTFILQGKHHLFKIKDLRKMQENGERAGRNLEAIIHDMPMPPLMSKRSSTF